MNEKGNGSKSSKLAVRNIEWTELVIDTLLFSLLVMNYFTKKKELQLKLIKVCKTHFGVTSRPSIASLKLMITLQQILALFGVNCI